MSFEQSVQIGTMVGTWLAGIGSLAAAGVALRLAHRSSKVWLDCHVGLRWEVGVGPKKELFMVSVTNCGERPVIISQIAWSNGKKNCLHGVQIFSSHSPSKCPETIAYGETAHFHLYLTETLDFIERLATDFVQPNIGRKLKTLRLNVYTSTGYRKTVIPEKSFLKRLETAHKEAMKTCA